MGINGVEIMNGMDARVTRGKEIALHPERIERTSGDTWSVPSQTGVGRYQVWSNGIDAKCECEDHKKRSAPCKHIFAVMELQLKEAGQTLSGSVLKPKKQYPQDWKAYNRGQTGEMRLVDTLLRDLVSGVPDLPRIPGAHGPASMPLRDALYCAILKVYSGLSCRRAQGVHRNVAERGLLSKVPSFPISSQALNRPEATAILYQLLTLSAMPLAGLEDGGNVSPDSTGIQTTSFGGWREEKHGEKRQKHWLKVHAMVGTKTHVIISAVVSDVASGDAPQFEPLLRSALAAGFHPAIVTADKGYLSRDNYTLADDLKLNAYIPFKVNSISAAGGSPAWHKAYHLFQANRAEFDLHYHLRSNVESVFSALKRKFGEFIRSRTTTAQVNEVLCKLICYNLSVVIHEMFENGIAPNFVLETKLAEVKQN